MGQRSAELNIVEKVIALEGVELLQDLTPEQTARIAAVAREIRVARGTTILEAYSPADALYVLVEGAVELSRDGRTVATARQYEMLGAWALYEKEGFAPLAAGALQDARLLRIGIDDLRDLLVDDGEITSSIFSTLVRRFRKLLYEMDDAGSGVAEAYRRLVEAFL